MKTIRKNLMFVFFVFAASVGVVNAAVDYNQPFTPDSRTIGLWHMNSIASNAIASDPAGKDLQLLTGNPQVAGGGTIVSGPTAALGNALRLVSDIGWFDDAGTHELAQSSNTVWQGYRTVEVEGWVNFDNIANGQLQYVVGEQNAFWVRATGDGWLTFLTFFNYANDDLSDIGIDVSAYSAKWLHFTAIFDDSGHKSLNVFSLDGTLNQTVTEENPGKKLDNVVYDKTGSIIVGSEAGYRRFMTGAVDEIRVYNNGLCPQILSADFNHDCVVNMLDFAVIAGQWLQDTMH